MGNDWSTIRHQSIFWTIAGVLFINHLVSMFECNSKPNTNMYLLNKMLANACLKVPSILFRRQYVDGSWYWANILICI